ncbi:complement receptor type 1 [Emys orbicularis]|uniref:complement receptor type 1 n=1 Tax=Emys orbicularis TaxID=82168 RepID=UPI0031FD0DC6
MYGTGIFVLICAEVRCPAPQIRNGRRVSGDRQVYSYKDSVTFECDPGYTMKGHSLSQCQTDDTWDPPLPICEPATCMIPEVENGRTNGVQPAYGPRDTVVFECDPGFTLSGSPETQCQDDGRWDPPVPVCERMLQCPSPPAIANGKPSIRALAVFTTGTSVNYSCEPGYSLTGQASIYCTASGTWSPPPPQCEEVLCIAPEIKNGRKVAGRGPVYRPRDTVRFECDPDYTLNGSHQIQCRDDRTWDPPVPVCIQALPCPPPPVIVRGKHNAKPLAAFPSGTYVNYNCEPGYALRGEATIYCTTSGTWSQPSPLCEEGCGVPTRLSFAELKSEYKNQSYFPVGKTINYTCRPGYSRQPRMQSTITCLENRTWSEAFEFCKKKSCGHPGEPENGRVIITDLLFGSTVNFACEEGHRLIGRPYRRCEISGTRVAWSSDIPICERIPCLPPPDIPNGKRTGKFMKNFSYGSAVTYKCDSGYPLTGEASIHCTTEDGLNGVWSARPPRCGEVRCPAPQIQNGRRVSGDRHVYSYKDSVTFECDPGYTMKGHSLSQCQTDDTWNPPLPVCEPVLQCPSPPDIANGKPSVQASAVFTTGTSVNYSCEPGYSLTGQASIYCMASGTWSPPPPRCEEVLCIAPEIEHGRKVAGHGPVYRPRDTVRFECDPGYTLNGSRQIQCQDDRTWDPPVPVCIQATCISPEVKNGRTNGVQPAYRPRDIVVFECDPGYTLSGSPETQCQDDGRWDPPVPVCERMLQCPSPPAIANGKPSGWDLAVFTSGMSVNYSCEPGYSLTGQASIYCTASGTWSPPPPQCKEVLCITPEIENGRKVAGRGPVYRPRDTVRFECDPGYTLNGSHQIQCRDEGTWDPPLPVCIQVTCISPEVENGRTNGVLQPAYRPRDIVVFECDPGYTLSGSPETQCQDDGRWDPPVPVCERMLQCPSPPAIANGKPRGRDLAVFTSGMSVNYSCEPGYSLTGQASIYCTASGTWSPPPPQCEEVLCIAPEIQSGRKVAGRGPVYRPRDTVTFECDPGYTLNGSRQIQCRDEGTWDPPVPACTQEVLCIAPEIQHGRKVAGHGPVYRPRDTVRFECDPGYTLNGSRQIQCQDDRTWDPPVPVCIQVMCISPEVENGRTNGVLQPAYRPRDIVVFECDPGYTLSGSPETQCQNDGRWDPPVPVCERMLQCPSPPAIANGKPSGWVSAVFTSGISVNYSCEPGYSLTGQASIYCTASGTWSPPPPRCEEVVCITPEIHHGRKVAGRGPVYRPRDTVTFECDPGYTLNGSRQIQCRDDRTWDPPVPACIQALRCPPPPVIVKGKHNAKPLATFPSGTYVNYSCEPGYALRGEASIYCTTSGTWSHPSPLCEGEWIFGWLLAFGYGCGVPTRFTFAELKSEYKNQSYFPVGKTINYTCRPGYSRQPQIPPTITCLQNRRWSEALKFCKKKSCGHPGEPENGRVIITDALFGSTVNFTCEEGHRLIGQPYRRCEISGMHVAWSGEVPICETTCISPEVENGRTNGVQPAYRPRDIVVFECDPGYTLSGSPETQCQDDGRWDPPVPVCERMLQCPSPPAIANGKPSGWDLAVFTSGMSVNYSCEPGYSLTGQASIYCTASGTWSPLPPRCEEVLCITPEIQHGRKVAGRGPVYRPRDTVRFQCDPGYNLIGNRQIQCRYDRTWDLPVPVCIQALRCPPPPVIVKGKHNAKPLATFPSGTYVNYSCEPGYALRGEASIYCTTSGTWRHRSPLCEEIRCAFPEIQGGKKAVAGTTYRFGTNVTLECDNGYVLEGSSLIQCQHDFTWNPPVPVCKSSSYNFISVVLGIVGGVLLLLLVTIIIWRIMSKQNAGSFKPRTKRERDIRHRALLMELALAPAPAHRPDPAPGASSVRSDAPSTTRHRSPAKKQGKTQRCQEKDRGVIGAGLNTISTDAQTRVIAPTGVVREAPLGRHQHLAVVAMVAMVTLEAVPLMGTGLPRRDLNLKAGTDAAMDAPVACSAPCAHQRRRPRHPAAHPQAVPPCTIKRLR